MPSKSNVLVVLSGGLDSTALMSFYSKQNITALSVDYGQRHKRELKSAALIAKHYNAEHIVLDLTSVGSLLSGSALTDSSIDVPEGHYAAESMKSTVVPNRNSILINIATGLAISKNMSIVAVGVHAGDHAIYPDCRPEFIDSINASVRVANEGFNPPKISAPFVYKTKADIVSLGTLFNAPFKLSWSCYKGGEKHCGVCGTCVERREAFEIAGILDPTEYLCTR